MRQINNVDSITNSQNEGRPCPHCGSRFGHYIHCSQLGGTIAKFAGYAGSKTAPTDAPALTATDRILLTALGIVWDVVGGSGR